MTVTAVDELLAATPEVRAAVLRALTPDARAALRQQFALRKQNPWLAYTNDPVGYVTKGLRESVWSKQVEVLESVRDHKRTAVPACHAPGKTHIGARAITWWIACHPPGTARVVTTATIFRQVKNILWPHIRRVHAAHNLPGEVLTTEWKINGNLVADGFSAADHNEAAVQGIHEEHLLIVVDEAGGISPVIGQALESLTTGGHTRLLVMGNPPTNSLGGWFERACNSPRYNVIPIPASATPNFTGEDVGPWAKNLVDRAWVDDVTAEFGEQAAFVQARVHARFPRVTANIVIPVDWLEAAAVDTPATTGRVRLGVDVAADGGDEFAIGRADGMTARIVHTSTHNANAVDVCSTILIHIRGAEADHEARGITEPVTVKVDAIGLGWGVVGLLETWRKEGQHKATIIGVNVGEKAHDPEKFMNQRAEMWWAVRGLLQPDAHGDQTLALCVDTRTMAQLAAPTYKNSSTGRIQIEAKADMRKRGVTSPDRAEAVLLAVYDPPRKETPLSLPVSLTQSNQWA